MLLDLVFPDNNEEEFLKIAEKLDYKGLVFCYTTHPKGLVQGGKIKLFLAFLARKEADIKKYRKEYDIVLFKGKRKSLEGFRADIMFGVEAGGKDMIHQRNSGLNQVLCKQMADEDIVFGFNFNSVLLSKNKEKIIGRMLQNIKLCRKYGVKVAIFSGAKIPTQMRAYKDMENLFEFISSDNKFFKKNRHTLYNLIKENEFRKSDKYIAEGIRKV